MEHFLNDLLRNASSPLSSLILQILVILLAARLCGFVMRYLGQPQVVGEIIAGICLGPSLLGLTLPEVHAVLFPDGSMQRLYFLSQVGILLFMFVVGLELDFSLLRSRAKAAIVISQVSIIIPCLLGVGLAFLLYEQYGMPDSGLLPFALFMGIAMSITAFPVLARIVQEQGLTRTPLGATALTCAAVDDVTAWCMLAFVVGLVQSGSGANAAWAIGSAVAYALFMLMVVRPFLRARLGPRLDAPEPSYVLLSVTFMAMLLSAFITEAIGIHALFGAFLMGVVMPEHNRFKEKLIARIQDVTTVVLLPLFFTFTGLRTQLGLLDDMQSWLICGLVVFVAVLGKVGGAVAAARLTGYPWRMSWMLGALMNTRGLMELIVLNIGYDLGILSPRIFTMMVIMAVVTTMMTGPIVRLLNLPGKWADSGGMNGARPG